MYTSLFKDHDCFSKSEHTFQNQGSFTHTPHHSNHNLHSTNTNKFAGKNANHTSNYHNTNYKHKGQYNNHYTHGNGQKSTINYGAGSHRPSKPITKVFDISLTNDPMGEVKKKLKGLLNIINNNNHKKIVAKVKALLTLENAKTVYETILINTCNQVFYITVFINLIMELNAYMPATGEVCVSVVNEFIENFIYAKEYIMENGANNDVVNEYDAFCAHQKHKCMITSKNLVIVEFLKRRFSQKWTVQSYADGLLDTLNELHSDVKAKDETNTDIILTLLKDLKNVDKQIKLDTSIIAKLLTHNYNQRITFMAQDLISISMGWQRAA